jgi:hypothetical protein
MKLGTMGLWGDDLAAYRADVRLASDLGYAYIGVGAVLAASAHDGEQPMFAARSARRRADIRLSRNRGCSRSAQRGVTMILPWGLLRCASQAAGASSRVNAVTSTARRPLLPKSISRLNAARRSATGR